jgi:lipoprotein-anchoring transpeptidase ErfK/SrfK
MKRPLFNLMFAAVLAVSAVLGVVTPTSAAHVRPVADNDAIVTDAQDTGWASDDGTTFLDAAAAASSGERWIEINLAQRRLYAHVGSAVVFSSLVSIGKPSTPTVRGTFRVYSKLRSTRMRGPGYNLPNVPHTMYFYRGYAIHGAYWVKAFGTRVSHGCVNMNLKDAAWLFSWAPVGTRVVIR